MTTIYGIDSADGNELTSGLSEHEARTIARRIARNRGETVYLYPLRVPEQDDEEIEAEAIDP